MRNLGAALGPNASKNRRRVAVSRPGAAHTSRPLSWSTTTVRYLWWRLYEISSMPIRRRPANRSILFSVSLQTRATIDPTVRQAIRINSHTAVFEQATASHATVSSNA